MYNKSYDQCQWDNLIRTLMTENPRRARWFRGTDSKELYLDVPTRSVLEPRARVNCRSEPSPRRNHCTVTLGILNPGERHHLPLFYVFGFTPRNGKRPHLLSAHYLTIVSGSHFPNHAFVSYSKIMSNLLATLYITGRAPSGFVQVISCNSNK